MKWFWTDNILIRLCQILFATVCFAIHRTGVTKHNAIDLRHGVTMICVIYLFQDMLCPVQALGL